MDNTSTEERRAEKIGQEVQGVICTPLVGAGFHEARISQSPGAHSLIKFVRKSVDLSITQRHKLRGGARRESPRASLGTSGFHHPACAECPAQSKAATMVKKRITKLAGRAHLDIGLDTLDVLHALVDALQ